LNYQCECNGDVDEKMQITHTSNSIGTYTKKRLPLSRAIFNYLNVLYNFNKA
jgi:hypothetical protein